MSTLNWVMRQISSVILLSSFFGGFATYSSELDKCYQCNLTHPTCVLERSSLVGGCRMKWVLVFLKCECIFFSLVVLRSQEQMHLTHMNITLRSICQAIIGGRLFMLQPFSTERFELEKNFPRSRRFWETFKFALVPQNAQILGNFNFS